MKMKKCELCKFPARTYCESDQASLCWDCDARVHGANFLVARHSRGLLCHTCQSLTPWRASGSKLGHTISVCQRCTGEPHNRRREEEEGSGEDKEEESDESGSTDTDDVEIEGADLEDDEDEDEDEDGDGDNQVVPWAYAPPPPPPASSPSSASKSSEDSVSRFACSDGEFSESVNAVSLKRTRGSTADPPSSLLQDGFNRSSCQWNYDSSALTTRVSGCDFHSRRAKYQRTEPGHPAVQSGSRSAAIIKRFNEN